MSYYVEICSAMGGENTYVRFEQDGRITVLMGTQASGQGHETSYAQMVAAELGIDIESESTSSRATAGLCRPVKAPEALGRWRSVVLRCSNPSAA